MVNSVFFKMIQLVYFVLLLVLFINGKYFNNAEKALFLTPLIEENDIEYARREAKVNIKNITSYSGYLTVNKEFKSHLFFWFFPAQNDYENAPVILWLQGGPGQSSMFGLFAEHGPYLINKDNELELRKHTWTKNHSVIYVDSPIGTGFSFTETGNGYAESQKDIARDLYRALLQFFRLFPELQKNMFFVTGESYAGKYVPSISYMIHENNPKSNLKINLQGMAIASAYSDPLHQMSFGDNLYQLGLIDSNTKKEMLVFENGIKQAIENNQWLKAFVIYEQLEGLFRKKTGLTSRVNYLLDEDSPRMDNYTKEAMYLLRDEIKSTIGVGNRKFIGLSTVVYQKLLEDYMQSASSLISELLSNYRMIFYNGQLDLSCAYTQLVDVINNLQFNGAEEYKTATRKKWFVNSKLAGYFKIAGNLTEVMVRNAGHSIPADQPEWALDLITRFTRNISLDSQ